jgi:threonine/homoserine/homoserine lactone efflux protein
MDILNFSGIGAERYTLYLIAEFAMVVSPGGAVLLVMNRGIAQGFQASIAATLGVLSANGLYFIASAVGLSALAIQFPIAFKLLQWAGAAYLLYLAWGAWTARPGGLSLSASAPQSNAAAFRQALWMQLANPKAMLTFAAIVPPFINPAYAVAPQMAWLAAGSMIPELAVLMVYGLLAAKLSTLLNQPARLRLIERVCALLLVAIATMIVWA